MSKPRLAGVMHQQDLCTSRERMMGEFRIPRTAAMNGQERDETDVVGYRFRQDGPNGEE